MAGFLRLRSYAPIAPAGISGPGPSSLDVKLGDRAFVASWERPGRFGAFFDVENNGRLPVTIDGLAEEDGGDSLSPPLELYLAEEAGRGRYSEFRPVTLEPGETAFLGVEVVAGEPCEGFATGSRINWESVPHHFSYARFFEREAAVPLPVRLALDC